MLVPLTFPSLGSTLTIPVVTEAPAAFSKWNLPSCQTGSQNGVANGYNIHVLASTVTVTVEVCFKPPPSILAHDDPASRFVP